MGGSAEIEKSRRALGSRLAEHRRAAGLSQHQLAGLIGYSRSAIATAETGRRPAARDFWQRCDQVLVTGGVLVRMCDELERLLQQRRQAAARAVQAARWSRAASLRPSDAIQGGSPLEAMANEVALLPAEPRRRVLTADEIDELLGHLREQWHLLVRTDNLFGPRYALAGVLLQLRLIQDLLPSMRVQARNEFIKLAAQYAESAAWLHEDGGDLPAAAAYNGQAMAWAHEAGDDPMLAWTLFRRSQQATYRGDAASVIGLCQAARRNRAVLTAPMLAAIAQQEAHGYALDGDEVQTQRLLDESHRWAATDTTGDAREGHGSFCTDSYLELQRAACWLRLGYPNRAIELYEATLPSLPTVYRRDRGVALGRFARAQLAAGQPEPGAEAASDALHIALDVGSQRTVRQVQAVGALLKAHRQLPPVAQLLDELAVATAF